MKFSLISLIIQYHLQTEVNKLRAKIASEDQRLTQQVQGLQPAEMEKTEAAQNFTTVCKKICNFENGQLLNQTDDLKQQLLLREQELQLLKLVNQQDVKETQQKVVSLKEEEITSLNGQLLAASTKLKKEISNAKEELYEAVAKLREKIDAVQSLQQVNDETKLDLDIERKKVDHYQVLYTVATSPNKEDYVKEIQVMFARIEGLEVITAVNTE